MFKLGYGIAYLINMNCRYNEAFALVEGNCTSLTCN